MALMGTDKPANQAFVEFVSGFHESLSGSRIIAAV
jgi:hypothetical protein